jgi:hypothetical protein
VLVLTSIIAIDAFAFCWNNLDNMHFKFIMINLLGHLCICIFFLVFPFMIVYPLSIIQIASKNCHISIRVFHPLL